MGDLPLLVTLALWFLVLFGPAGLACLAADAKSVGRPRSARGLARVALWSGILVYAVLVAVALLLERSAPPPGQLPKIRFTGWTRLPFWAEVALGTNGLAVLWSFWILRDVERNPDTDMVDAALAEEREEEARRRSAREAGCRP